MDRFLDEELGKVVQQVDLFHGHEGYLGVKEVSNVIENKPVGNLYSFLVDYNRKVEDGISAGKYDLVDHVDFRDFQTKQKGIRKVTAELSCFNHYITTDDVLRRVEKRGRPADFVELLAFGETYPNVQLKFPIVALESVFHSRGKRFAPYLGREISERSLRFALFGNGWVSSCRFMVIRDRE